MLINEMKRDLKLSCPKEIFVNYYVVKRRESNVKNKLELIDLLSENVTSNAVEDFLGETDTQ